MSDTINPDAISAFRRAVWRHFRAHGRDLPWRRKVTAYRVFVSEVMLQQTQVARVAEFFPVFIKRFPTFAALAASSPREALETWRGLGYNRRALWLRAAAQKIVGEHGGRLPRDEVPLRRLPGIGAATAASLAAFAFNRPTVFLETNIRAALIHHFFPSGAKVTERDLLNAAAMTLDRRRPRLWYSALMDYGSWIKRAHSNPSRRAGVHRPQPRFKGSPREARGAVVRALLAAGKPVGAAQIIRAASGVGPKRLRAALDALVAEGMLRRRGGKYSV
ncbi:MAG: A/G-specific adenine glycosylase [Nitrospinae bacterium]|nr:A/G-specific adenine glycosylase [Nitrospinota bacterium]